MGRPRTEMVAAVAALKAEGLNGIQIADRLGISRSYAYELITDPEGEKARARKPHGTCARCGAPTSYHTGGLAEHCKDCAPDANRTWTREYVIDAIVTFADRYGRQPTAGDWNPAQARLNSKPHVSERFYRDACWPTSRCVQDIFGSWNAAIEAAGFSPLRPAQQMTYLGAMADAAQRAEIVARYVAGESSAEIAEPLGMSPRTVLQWVRAAGEAVRPPGGNNGGVRPSILDELAVARAAAMYRSGATLQEVAAAFGVAHATIQRAFVRAGVERRSRGARPTLAVAA